MKNIDKYLNALQLTHKVNPAGCCGKKCAYPGCGVCLCDKRNDAQYCCDQHRSAANNIKYEEEHGHYKDNIRKNKINQRIFIDLYERELRVLDREALNIRGVNFSAFPAPIFINNKMLAGFGPVGVWMDSNKMFHIEKIK